MHFARAGRGGEGFGVGLRDDWYEMVPGNWIFQGIGEGKEGVLPRVSRLLCRSALRQMMMRYMALDTETTLRLPTIPSTHV